MLLLKGITLKPGENVAFEVIDAIHISSAVLERDTNQKVGHCEVWAKKQTNMMIAVLNKRVLNVPLNLILTSGEKVVLYMKGTGTVHLTGFFLKYESKKFSNVCYVMLINLSFYSSRWEPEKVIAQTIEKEKNEETVTINTLTPKLKCNVLIEDLLEGTGIAAKVGDSVSIYYQSYLVDSENFINVHTSGEPFKLQLGERKAIIKGLDEGIVGMKAGSKRKITCPPEMAFGKVGIPSLVPPDATVVCEVELKSINIADST